MKNNSIKRDFKKTMAWLDGKKFAIYQKGIRFFIAAIYDDNDTQCVGMGTGGEMCELILEQLYNLQLAAVGTTTEKFAESIKEQYIRYKEMRDKDDNFGMAIQIKDGEQLDS